MDKFLIPVPDFLDFAEVILDALADNRVPDDVAATLSVEVSPDAVADGKLAITMPVYREEAGGKRVR